MRLFTLALSALSLAGFTISETNNIKAPSIIHQPSTKTFITTTIHRHRNNISLTLPLTSPCHHGSTSTLDSSQTNTCTNTLPHFHMRPCKLSWYAYWHCARTLPTSKTHTSNNISGTRSARWAAQFTARTTQYSAESGVESMGLTTPTPTMRKVGGNDAAADTLASIPICSFDLRKGEYVCPEGVGTLPICSFDLREGRYVCPEVGVRTEGVGRG